MKNIKLWQILGYAGLIPFVSLTWLYVSGVTKVGLPISLVFICYSAAILSFMAGSLWLQKHDEQILMPTLCSNLVSLSAFLSILLVPWVSVLLLTISYLFLLGLEFGYKLFDNRPQGYKFMRIVLTTVVVSCHLVLLNAT